MKLKCINSGSKGNCYVLESSTGEVLLIECGVKYAEILRCLNFKISSISGCVCSHEDQDHIKSIFDLLGNGIRVFSSKGTFDAVKISGHHNTIPVKHGQEFCVGSFHVKAFNIKHDAKEPIGFLIWHEEMGLMLFMTDTYYCEYRFSGLNHILIEANYSQDRLDKGNGLLRNRIMSSHMSISTCVKTLQETDLSDVKNIVLIHLSDSNSDEREFIRTVENNTGKFVYAAQKGLELNFNKEIF